MFECHKTIYGAIPYPALVATKGLPVQVPILGPKKICEGPAIRLLLRILKSVEIC